MTWSNPDLSAFPGPAREDARPTGLSPGRSEHGSLADFSAAQFRMNLDSFPLDNQTAHQDDCAHMLPQYIITLGARAIGRGPDAAAGIFNNDDYQSIETIVRDHGFPGSTIIRCKGSWEGKPEDSVQIIILEKSYGKVEACARQLINHFGQVSVLVSLVGVGELLYRAEAEASQAGNAMAQEEARAIGKHAHKLPKKASKAPKS